MLLLPPDTSQSPALTLRHTQSAGLLLADVLGCRFNQHAAAFWKETNRIHGTAHKAQTHKLLASHTQQVKHIRRLSGVRFMHTLHRFSLFLSFFSSIMNHNTHPFCPNPPKSPTIVVKDPETDAEPNSSADTQCRALNLFQSSALNRPALPLFSPYHSRCRQTQIVAKVA